MRVSTTRNARAIAINTMIYDLSATDPLAAINERYNCMRFGIKRFDVEDGFSPEKIACELGEAKE